ncbi:hypothetical protein [Ramlibacter tataouinensis]|uniref:Uncharacterized protein n=1 Tax=Ramlibacter tataouinensis (strain ATCC BAA-407 / DSM 14655 / LMG 21543 / TTB310) TaxID=365046 RepID=F5Y1M1_RAMTT|nr:hypothetical protein [Ramlibacter tataouinensis]AEG92272.1 hypothetical protein Rta_11860 [Ramlibacter tataouinensis TTB310]
MTPSLLFAFLLDGKTVQVAIQSPGGEARASAFPDSEQGIQAFDKWLKAENPITDPTTAHSCVATSGEQDEAFFSSPFVEFAYNGTRNTSAWSKDRLLQAGGGELSATALLRSWAKEEGYAA